MCRWCPTTGRATRRWRTWWRPGSPLRWPAALARGVPLRAVMLDRLGPNVWHRTPGEASAVLEELEETARLWLASGHQAQALSPEAIAALCAAFSLAW
jgi:hypothetical protein